MKNAVLDPPDTVDAEISEKSFRVPRSVRSFGNSAAGFGHPFVLARASFFLLALALISLGA